MSTLVVGLSYRTAPVGLLERATVAPEQLPAVLTDLVAQPHVEEAMVLSTCNRVEVYAEVGRFHGGVTEVSDLLAARLGVDLAELGGHLYVHYEDAAVQHLFTVASGLDSMVVGEAQVLGQVRAAYAGARAAGTAGRSLHELVQQALRVGKRVHSQTGIDAVGRSVVGIGVGLAAGHLGGLAGRGALIIGAGAMGSLAVAALRRAGIDRLVVANRTVQRGARLAAGAGGRAVGLDEIERELPGVDVIVSSTGATGIVLPADLVARAQKVRAGRPLAVLDLALPRDVDPAVGDLDAVALVDLEQVRTATDTDPVRREVAVARGIVADEVGAYLLAQRSAQVAPTVAALRARADDVVSAELARLAARLPALDPGTRAELETTVHRVVATLLHAPTVRVKELAGVPGGDAYAAALRELFGLDPRAAEAVVQASVEATVAAAAGVDEAPPPPEVRGEGPW